MKKILLTTLISGAVFASVGESTLDIKKINKGNWSLSASGGSGYATGDIGFVGHADLSGAYYLIDNLAIGLDTMLDYSTGANTLRGYIGPTIQYNFYNNNILSTYIKLGALNNINFNAKDFTLRADVGVDFWLGKTFTIGPFMRTNYLSQGGSGLLYSDFGGRLGIHF